MGCSIDKRDNSKIPQFFKPLPKGVDGKQVITPIVFDIQVLPCPGSVIYSSKDAEFLDLIKLFGKFGQKVFVKSGFDFSCSVTILANQTYQVLLSNPGPQFKLHAY